MDIVFLHGFAAGGAVWEPYRSLFPAAHMPTLHFSSDGAPDLPDLVGPTLLVGWSMGGMIAVEMLRRQPDFVKGILLVSSSPSYVASDRFPEGKTVPALRELRNAVRDGDAKALQGFQRQLFTAAEIRDGWLARFRREIGPSLPTDPGSLLSQLAFLERYRAPDDLPACPVTILHGVHDNIVDVAAVGAWRRLFPAAKARTIDTGHALPYVHAEILTTLLPTVVPSHVA